MSNERTLTELLRKIIYKETAYLRHYLAKVVDNTDPKRKGKVKADCYDLGMDSGHGMWFSPRQKDGLTIPKIGDWIEVYFMSGDRNRPVYIGKAVEMEGMIPKSYDGKSTTQVVFEDPNGNISIVYDSIALTLKIKSTGSVIINDHLEVLP